MKNQEELNQEPMIQVENEILIDDHEDIMEKVKKYGRYILAGAAGLLVVLLVGYFVNSQKEEEINEASVALSRIQAYYFNGEYDKALNGDKSIKIDGMPIMSLPEVAEQYSGTDQGMQAALYAANAYLVQNKLAEAAKFFDMAGESESNVLKMGALAGMGACREKEGKALEAADLYLQASQLAVQKNTEFRYKYYAGKLFEVAKDTKKAEELYNQIVADTYQNEFTTLAKSGLARLGMKIE